MDLWSERVAGIVARFVLLVSSVCGTTGQEACDGALVSGLPPAAFSSSSQLSSSHAAGFARLNRREGAGGWSPLASDRHPWLQVDLGGRTQVCAVATQGRYGSSDWLTSYLLMFSDAGHNWKQYRQEDSTGAFPGNTNADSVVQYKLQQPLIARFLRLIPLDWNPNGRIGLRLESYGCRHASDVLSLGSGGGLVFLLGPGPRPASTELVSLSFKALGNRGTVLRADGRGGLSLSLELDRGKLQLLVRQDGASSSEARQLASLGSLLDDQQWHHVLLERHRVHLNLTVDKHTEEVQVPAGFSLWDMEELSVGAGRVSGTNFHGCLENLLYNHLNLIQLVKRGDHRVTAAGNVTFSCAEPVSVAVTFPGPQSFLQLPGPSAPASDGFSVGFQFRTWNKAGLLLTFDLPQHRGTVWLCLSDASLLLRVQRDGRAELELSAGSALNDGQWHSAALTSRPGRLSVAVDGDGGGVAHASPSFPVTAAQQLFFGGCPLPPLPPPPPPPHDDSAECRNLLGVFQGCMRLFSVDNAAVDLTLVQQRLMGNYSQLQIDMCGMIDRCSPSRCEHGGRCSQTWTVFHCNCSDSGYSGATCHSSVFEPSCEAYKHNGNASGHFYIDVDGSGPVQPQLVYCNMTEETTWMVIQHNNSELTRLQPSPGENQHVVHFDYSSQEDQLLAAISQSDQCQQEVSYRCRRSRLLNTPEGAPFSWWLGGTGSGLLQTYWGGAHPGSQQCVCGLRGDCVDPQHYCNCDADRLEWAEDSGLLTHKESLPVRALVLGDIQRPGSEAAYRVGPLRCHGDKNFWNAAFFDRETSYLHFPTFRGELSADISFLFKTTASSGVFLENLGIKDFIRIELSSSDQVTFSFDVGDGPLQVRVASSAPLNDGRWHRVRAERNVKEALLQVDRLPAATQEAPTDGHFHLQLNSQLFIGGTASRQKGFRGCIRSLRLNGATLDLEERARITPGVRPGCPGHCSSYGAFCQNGGRCVERVSGFACDCSSSAHAGAFCHAEVSAGFTSSTSISYTFIRNSSALSSSIFSDTTLRGEDVSLSFRTSQSPALLLYVSSYYTQYLAVLLNERDELEVRYRLDSSREAEVLRSRVGSLANGQLHSVSIRRRTDSVSVQVDQSAREDFNLTSDGEFKAIRSLVLGRVYSSEELDPDLSGPASLGFTGCLSVVLFNSVSPLKAALLQPGSGPVVTGPLVHSSCGSAAPADGHAADRTPRLSDQSGSGGSGQPQVNAIRTHSALIGGVIAVGIFLLASGLAGAARFLYRRKETYQSQDVRVQRDDSRDLSFRSQTDAHSVVCENPKECFM